MQPAVFSFFSGVGFLDLGFQTNGFDIAAANEFHQPFMDAYRHARDVLGIDAAPYGEIVCDVADFLEDRNGWLTESMDECRAQGRLVGFIGGPPCPDFSVGGKNRGRLGVNGKLTETYANLIITAKPDFFVFENVKGLLSTTRHREYFDEVKAKLGDAGYCMCQRLTNALEYGAPQDRYRIILFGIRKEFVGLPTGSDTIPNFPWQKYIQYSADDVKALCWPTTDSFGVDSSLPMPEGIIKELTVQYWFNKNHVETHPNADMYFTPRQGLPKMLSIDEGDVSKKSYKRLHRWRYSPTVAYGNNEVHLHPYKARRLSAAESLALQSLPMDFELPKDITLSDAFKTIGNGVPYLLASGVAKTVASYLESIM